MIRNLHGGRPRLASSLALSTLCLGQLIGVSVRADDAAADTETLDEVVVTTTRFFRPIESSSSTKMDIPIVETPQAVSIINSDILSTFNVTNVSQITKFTAGLGNLTDNVGERPNFISRGYALDLFDGYKLNGISYIPDQNIDPIALDRIEVIKGPTGITYGRNSYGGALNFVLKAPHRNNRNFIELASGSRDFTRAAVDFTTPVLDNLTLRLPVAYETRDAQATPDLKSVTFAPSLALQLSDDLSITLSTLYQDINSHLSYGLSAMAADVPTQQAGDFNSCYATRCVSPPDRLRNREYSVDWDFAKSNSVQTFLTIDYRLNERLKLTVNASNSDGRFDSDQLYVNGPMAADATTSFYVDRVMFRTRGHSLETNLTGDFDLFGGTHQFYVGADYRRYRRFEQNTAESEVLYALVDLDEVTSRRSLTSIFNDRGLTRPTFVVDRLREGTRTYAGLGAQVMVDLPGAFKSLLGARLERSELDYDETPIAPGASWLDYELRDTEILPRASLIYEFTPHMNMYASYTEGYVPQFGQTRGGGNIAPETGRQYEVGLKAELFERRLLATLAAYHLKREGVSINDPNNLPGEQFVIGGLEQTNKGVEVEVIGQLVRGLSIAASASVISAKLGDYDSILANRFIAGVPKNTASAFLTYETLPGQAGNLTLSGGVAYTGMQYGGAGEVWRIPSYTVVDAAIGYQFSDNLNLKLSASNLLDEVYVNTIGSPNYLTQFGEPRTFKLIANIFY
jgi:iron complex outermembrane receptor protein